MMRNRPELRNGEVVKRQDRECKCDLYWCEGTTEGQVALTDSVLVDIA